MIYPPFELRCLKHAHEAFLQKSTVGETKDIFNDPDGKLSNNTAPVLLSKIDNTKPFTLTAKVSPGCTAKGLYNASVLFLYVNDDLGQKFCFGQDEHGKHCIVTVRTVGTSDDNNHDVVTVSTVSPMRIITNI